MRLGLLVANGFVLAGIAWMAGLGPDLRASALVPSRPMAMLGGVAELETQAATDPSPAHVAALAAAYLDREQPGLASAVIERAPDPVRALPEVAQLEARALLRRGRAREALAAAERASNACAAGSCAPWLAAKSARQVAFLQQIVAAGIDDPLTDPVAARAAYERSSREVGLFALR